MIKKLHNYEKLAVDWHDMQLIGPAPRHRKRLIFNYLKGVDFKSVLDVGCGQGYMLQMVAKRLRVKKMAGVDISSALIKENKRNFPSIEFDTLDLEKNFLKQKFDLVMCQETIEHIDDYKLAIKNLCAMSKRYVLITVPTGKIFKSDRIYGHYRHFKPKVIKQELEKNGFGVVKHMKWGFPFHNLYKILVNQGDVTTRYNAYARSFSLTQKLLAHFLYGLFFLNLPYYGFQLVVLAKKRI